MKIDIMGVGQTRLLSINVKTLDDAGILNISGLCRKLGVKRSTFLSKVASVGLEKSIIYYAALKNSGTCSPLCQRKTPPYSSQPATLTA